MAEVSARNWWVWLVRGIAAILFGIATFVMPGIVLQTLIFLFAAYVIVDGVFSIIDALQNRQQPRWWAELLEGIISLIAGLGAILFPGMTALVMLYFVAFWAILTGIMEIIAAIQLRKEIQGEFWLGLGGAMSVIFGIVLILFPGAGILSLLGLVGAYALIFGVVMILLAFRIRNMGGTRTNERRMA